MATWIERWPAPSGDGPTVAVKDLIDVAGSVTTGGCRALADRGQVATSDAACIESVRARGGRLVGKANLHELAFGTSGINPWFGTPRNPIDPGRVPGGSSSGSATAVAAGEADVALGTDTGGSIRIPAACCGVVGLKTTTDLIPLVGVLPLAPSYDTVGVLAADVRRTAVGMELLGVDMSPTGELPDVLGRVLLPASIDVDPVIDAAVDRALAASGLRTTPIRLDDWHEAYRAQQQVLVREAFEADRYLLEVDGGAGVSDQVRDRLAEGSKLSDAQVAEARTFGRAWAVQLAEALRRSVLLALPTLAIRPPVAEEIGAGFNVLTAPVNFAGLPAISLPVPVAGSGRPPCGLQLIGPPGSEPLLCATAAVVEAAVSA